MLDGQAAAVRVGTLTGSDGQPAERVLSCPDRHEGQPITAGGGCGDPRQPFGEPGARACAEALAVVVEHGGRGAGVRRDDRADRIESGTRERKIREPLMNLLGPVQLRDVALQPPLQLGALKRAGDVRGDRRQQPDIALPEFARVVRLDVHARRRAGHPR